METKTLILFIFETGDASCRYYEVPILVNCPDGDCYDGAGALRQKLQDALSGVMNNMADDGEDFEYEDAAEQAVIRLGLPWNHPALPIGSIDRVITVFA